MRPIAEIIVHCSATHPNWMHGKAIDAKISEMRRWHKGLGWRDIGYHFIVDRNGDVGLGRPVAQIGAHVKGHNIGTIGVCLLGGHGSSADDRFSDNYTIAQDEALRDLIDELQHDFPRIQKISGHNEYAAKACPGFRVQPWLMAAPKAAPDVEIPRLTGWAGLRAFFRNLFT